MLFCVAYISPLILLLPTTADRNLRTTRPSNGSVPFVQNPKRDPHPQRVEKDKVQPQVHPVAGIQIRVPAQPLRGEGHETSVEFSRSEDEHPEPAIPTLLDDAVTYPRRQRCADEDGEELEGDDSEVGAAPSRIGLGILSPERTQWVGSIV